MSTSRQPGRKVDRRVSRTRGMLRDSLFALILEKGYQAVTVEEIAQRANVGRTTFYLHYRDKEDLLMQSISELVDDLVARLSSLPLPKWQLESMAAGERPKASVSEQPTPALTLPFQHVVENAQLYRVILRGEGTASVSRRLREILVAAIGEMIRVLQERDQLRRFDPLVPMEVIKNYLAGSWLGLVNWWLENDLPYPPEKMALMFQLLILRGVPDVLRAEPGQPD